jgi:hypothetical protein
VLERRSKSETLEVTFTGFKAESGARRYFHDNKQEYEAAFLVKTDSEAPDVVEEVLHFEWEYPEAEPSYYDDWRDDEDDWEEDDDEEELYRR